MINPIYKGFLAIFNCGAAVVLTQGYDTLCGSTTDSCADALNQLGKSRNAFLAGITAAVCVE